MSGLPADYKRKYRVPACFIVLRRDGKFFALRRANTGWMDGVFTLPSGHVEEDETFLEAAIRETQEEAGVMLEAKNVHFAHLCERDEQRAMNERVWDDVYFVCDQFEGEPHNAEPEKASEGKWFDLENPPQEELVPTVYHALQQIKQGRYYSAYPAK